MNFGLAREQALAEGLRVEMAVVSHQRAAVRTYARHMARWYMGTRWLAQGLASRL